MLEQQVTMDFSASTPTEFISKKVIFKFIIKKTSTAGPEVVIEPVYCTGNFNAKTTLESFTKDEGLSAKEWKTNSLSYFYFDCDKHKKDFKLDPVKVEKGLYSETEMNLVGKTKNDCCDDKKAFKVELGAPLVPKKKIDFEGLVTITFD
jgi:hypothetical protein